jgi:methylmalonyl-CoA/ethylmalonyl-CoA epimerase
VKAIELWDIKDHVFLTLSEVLSPLPKRASMSMWDVSDFVYPDGEEYFDIASNGEDPITPLANTGTRIAGYELASMRHSTPQIIWATFRGYDPGNAAEPWIRLHAEVKEPQVLAEHGVTVVFVRLENTKIELMTPLGPDSPIAAFLEKNPAGGIHHLCFEVPDLASAAKTLTDAGARVIGTPSVGAHGLPVLFLHPKDFDGTLIELEEVKPDLQPA